MLVAKDSAVVLLSYNSRKWHELFLPKIVSEAKDLYDVYVVDHASSEPLSDYIRAEFPSVKLIRLNENHGFAWGYATALKQVKAKYYVLLSADFEVTDDWFLPLHSYMESHGHVAACQPKVRYYRDREYFEYAGAAGGYKDYLGYLFCRGRIFDTLEKDKGQYDDDREIFWASGGCFMVRSSVYHEVGGLDADFGSHMEEVDLCWRMKNAGHGIAYVAGSTVYHVGGSVISYGSAQKTFFNFRNSLAMLTKNERLGKLLWLIPLRLSLDGVAGIQFLLKGQWKNTIAIIKAHFSFYSSFKTWWGKRQPLSGSGPKPNRQGIFRGSILVHYFLKRRKRFSDLPADKFVSG